MCILYISPTSEPRGSQESKRQQQPQQQKGSPKKKQKQKQTHHNRPPTPNSLSRDFLTCPQPKQPRLFPFFFEVKKQPTLPKNMGVCV